MNVKTYKCPSCGASLNSKTGVCDYCGTKTEISKKTFNFDEIGKKVNDFFQVDSDDEKVKKEKENKISLLIFGIILLFTFPPLGIVLIILALVKKPE